jgi:hypothetical protein
MPRLRAYVLPDLGVVPVLNYRDFVVEFLSPDPFGERLTISTLRSVVSFALGRFSISGWEGWSRLRLPWFLDLSWLFSCFPFTGNSTIIQYYSQWLFSSGTMTLSGKVKGQKATWEVEHRTNCSVILSVH